MLDAEVIGGFFTKIVKFTKNVGIFWKTFLYPPMERMVVDSILLNGFCHETVTFLGKHVFFKISSRSVPFRRNFS